MTTLDERLRQPATVIMDGGTGTEIERRGTGMNNDVWSGVAHMDDPDTALAVHADYIRAGAEIVIANTFGSSKHVLESAGLGDDFVDVNRLGVEIARQARDEAAEDPVWIAGSISSMAPLAEDDGSARRDHLEANYRQQAEVLAEAGADLIVTEMMLDVDGSVPAMRGAVATGLPVWVGFSATLTDDGNVLGFRRNYREETGDVVDFGELVDAVLAIGGDVAGVMHSDVAATGPALDVLATRWSGPTMAYAETGLFAPPHWQFEQSLSPAEYADVAAPWVTDNGVSIVGGCCGTGPDHIKELHQRLAP